MFQLHLAALASLKGEILDLSSRLHTVTQERDLLEKTLSKTQVTHLVAVIVMPVLKPKLVYIIT
jgi:hypothetical protein